MGFCSTPKLAAKPCCKMTSTPKHQAQGAMLLNGNTTWHCLFLKRVDFPISLLVFYMVNSTCHSATHCFKKIKWTVNFFTFHVFIEGQNSVERLLRYRFSEHSKLLICFLLKPHQSHCFPKLSLKKKQNQLWTCMQNAFIVRQLKYVTIW